jgi:hypothetical protein
VRVERTNCFSLHPARGRSHYATQTVT